jgi:hypothetical protein
MAIDRRQEKSHPIFISQIFISQMGYLLAKWDIYQPNGIFINQMGYLAAKYLIYHPSIYQPKSKFISQTGILSAKFKVRIFIYQPNSGVAGVRSPLRIGQIIT